jgi:MFS family permease
MINPAYILLADDLNVTVTKASYLTTVYILFSGITPMFLVPYANVYGRRNLYVVSDCAIFLPLTRPSRLILDLIGLHSRRCSIEYWVCGCE